MSDLANSMLEKVMAIRVERKRPECERIIAHTFDFLEHNYPQLNGVPQCLKDAFVVPNPPLADLIFVAETILDCDRMSYTKKEQDELAKWLKRQARQ